MRSGGKPAPACDAIGLLGGVLGGTVGGRSACSALGRLTSDGIGFAEAGTAGWDSGPGIGPGPGPGGGGKGVANGPGGGMPAPIPGAPTDGGDAIGPAGAIMPAGTLLTPPESALPQLRQNFMPGGLSPRHTLQVFAVGNRWGGAGVCPNADASELPQLRQNDDPAGLSWPHTEQRIARRVSQQPTRRGITPGVFATRALAC